jgi:hypothetical protein
MIQQSLKPHEGKSAGTTRALPAREPGRRRFWASSPAQQPDHVSNRHQTSASRDTRCKNKKETKMLDSTDPSRVFARRLPTTSETCYGGPPRRGATESLTTVARHHVWPRRLPHQAPPQTPRLHTRCRGHDPKQGVQCGKAQQPARTSIRHPEGNSDLR